MVAILGGTLAGLHQLQIDRIPAALLRQAQRAEEQGRLDTAIHYYRQYLEFRATDVEARIRLAALLRERSGGNNGRALAEALFLYDRVLHWEPNRHEVRREALAAALRIGRYSDALVHAQALLQVFPHDPLLWQQLGAAQAGLNQLPQARHSYEKALELAPEEPLAYQRLAQLLWRHLNDPSAARQVLERMVQALPAHPEAHLTRARFELYLQEQKERGSADATVAITHLQRVCELDPENLEATLHLAEIYQRRFRWDAAHYLLQEARSLYPRDLRVVRALSWLEVSRGNLPAAIAILEESLRQVPQAQELLIPLADLLIQQGDKVRTTEILQRLHQQAPATLPERYLHIRLAMRDQNWTEALQRIDALQNQVPRHSALGTQLYLLRAVCAEQLGDRAAAEKAFQSVLLIEPAHAQALHGLGQLYLDTGRFTEAARVWEQAAQSPYAAGPTVAHWIRFQTHQWRIDGTADENWRRLEQAVEQAANRFPPSSSEPIVLLANVLQAQGRFAEAAQRLRLELNRRPNDVPLWVSLIEVMAVWQGSTAAISIADEAQAACGDLPELRIARGTLLVQEPGRLRPLAPLLHHTEGWADSDQIRLWFGLLDIYEAAEDTSQVLTLLERLAHRRPGDPTLWLRLFQRAQQAGRTELAEQARRHLQTRYGADSEYSLLCQAFEAEPASAAAVLHRLVERMGPLPHQPDAALGVARLHQLLGQADKAAEVLGQAFANHPTHFAITAAWLRHLLMQQDEPALQWVVQRIRHDPRWGSLAIRRLLSVGLSELPAEKRRAAVVHLRGLIASQPGGLAYLGELAARWQLTEASALLQEAIRTTSATVDDWLRWCLVSGPETVAEATTHLSESSQATLLAVLQEAMPSAASTVAHQLRQASPQQRRQFVQILLGLHLSRQRYQEAIAVLEKYLLSKPQHSDQNWAKRQLALLHAREGSERGRQRAWELLEQAHDDPSASAEELRATAQVLATLSRFLDGSSRQQLLQRTAAALEAAWQKSRAPKDLYDLGQLYRSMGRRADRRRCLQILLNADPDNLHYLVAALEELLEAEDYAAAETFAMRLQMRHSDDYRAISALAHYWSRVGQGDKARQLVEQYIHRADASAGDYWMRLGQVASLLDELARLPQLRQTPIGTSLVQAAAERYAALVPHRPEAAVGWAGILAFGGQTSQALEQLQRLEPSLPVAVRAAAALAVVRNARISESQATLITRWIDAYYQQDPQDLAARLYRAEFWALLQETERAIAEYESLLQEQPNHVVVLNNLAWLLAGQPEHAQRALHLVNRALQQVGLTGDLLDTRARARISLRQLAEAEQDLQEALRIEATALRYFHLAVLHWQHTPPRTAAAAQAFAQAMQRGLEERNIHPTDRGLYRQLFATYQSKRGQAH
jgi:tetratricopeptide (TPR) repeat protein